MRNQGTIPTATQPRVIRIVLVEQYALVRQVLRDMLRDQPDVEVIAEASDVDQAEPIVQLETPDVVLIDTNLPVATVVPAVQRLKRQCPGSQIVLLSHERGDDELFAAIRAGAAAYVVDDARPAELLRTIRAVAGGEYVIDRVVAARPAVARHVLEAFRDASLYGGAAPGDPASSAFAPLSARETAILEAVAEGLTNKRIGEMLSISEQTVKNHVSNILRKLAVNGRTQAVLYALKKSWISISDEPPERRD